MVILVLFYLLFPALIIWLCHRYGFLNKIGAVILCYIAGMTIGNIGVIPEGSFKLQESLSEAGVALGMPLLLFSMDIRSWLKIAGKAIFCMLLAVVSIIITACLGVYLLHESLPEAWKLGGMAIGVYTGGTPNLAAIKEALGVDSTTYLIMHAYDNVIGMLFIPFCMIAAKPLFGLFLPKFEKIAADDAETGSGDDMHSYEGMLSLGVIKRLAPAMALVVIIVAAAVGLSGLMPKTYSAAIGILVITTGGVACSFIGRIRSIPKTFQLGMYFILVFCLVIGSLADFKKLTDINYAIMSLVVLCFIGTFFLHAVFCRIFKIDTDTFIITSVSALCSPPFVPPVANAIGNRDIILSGITTGIIGYAIGNYLGITFAYLFRALIG